MGLWTNWKRYIDKKVAETGGGGAGSYPQVLTRTNLPALTSNDLDIIYYIKDEDVFTVWNGASWDDIDLKLADLDERYAEKMHTHPDPATNRATLDKLSDDGTNLLFNGSAISGGTGGSYDDTDLQNRVSQNETDIENLQLNKADKTELHTHSNQEQLDKIGEDINGKLTYNGVVVEGGTGGSGSTVSDSTINGNILVDGAEVQVYDDSNKADLNHTHAELHTHSNSTTLDKLSDNGTELLFNGSVISGGSGGAGISIYNESDKPSTAENETVIFNQEKNVFQIYYDEEDAIPLLTSNTSDPSITLTSSSNFVGSYYDMYKVFDGVLDGSNAWITNTGANATVSTPQWLGVQHATPQTYRQVSLTARNSSGVDWAPDTFEIQGSNDGVNWTTLLSQSGVSWTESEKKTFLFDSVGSFTHYRLFVTKTQYEIKNGTPYRTGITEMDFDRVGWVDMVLPNPANEGDIMTVENGKWVAKATAPLVNLTVIMGMSMTNVSTATDLLFTTVNEDLGTNKDSWNPTLSEWTCPADGDYQIILQVTWSGTGTGRQHLLHVLKNGIVYKHVNDYAAGVGKTQNMTVNINNLAAGDKIKFQGQAGTASTISGDASYTFAQIRSLS